VASSQPTFDLWEPECPRSMASQEMMQWKVWTADEPETRFPESPRFGKENDPKMDVATLFTRSVRCLPKCFATRLYPCALLDERIDFL